MQRFASGLVAFWLILMAAVWSAQASDEEVQQQVLKHLEQFARGYDLNRQEKYHIDFFYSPLHAMPVYRELLLWINQPGISADLHEELLTTITAGMVAIVRDSHAGPAAESGPLGIGFLRALPRYAQEPDKSRAETLIWRSDEQDRRTTPAVIGRSLSAKALLLAQLSPQRPEYELLLASLRREYDALIEEILPLASHGYMPEVLTWEDGRWQIIDGRSRLFSQAALLRGLLKTRAMLDNLEIPDTKWRSDVQQQIVRLINNLEQHHFDPQSGSFVDMYAADKSDGDRIMLEGMVELIEALALVLQLQPEESTLKKNARQLGQAQIEFLLKNGDWEQLPPRGYLVERRIPLRVTVNSLEEPLAVLSILQHTELFGVEGGEQARQRTAELLEANYWSEAAGIYRSAVGFTASAYDGHLFALTLRWLRREGQQEKGDGLIRVVFKEAGLLQCEPSQAGETRSLNQALDEEGLTVSREIAVLPRNEQAARISGWVRQLADQDGDTVPGCRFGGGRFGGAPVPVIQTSITTPYPPRTIEQ